MPLPIAAAYGFASNFTYAAVGAALRQWLAHGRRLLWFNRAMAAVLAATALGLVLAVAWINRPDPALEELLQPDVLQLITLGSI